MNIRKTLFTAALASFFSTSVVSAGCPFGYGPGKATGGAGRSLRQQQQQQLPPAQTSAPIDQGGHGPHNGEVADFAAVKQDIVALLTDSQEFWPADFGNYGPFFIRLAWHCAGTYRLVDGRGGCDGARIRHLPERAWVDNVNLDKAIDLLTPLKRKYGASLSWGDLIVLAGTTAIEAMEGPAIGFCGGRVDDLDGSESLELDPAFAQTAHCDVDGACEFPFGATTSGLIYVNPEGPMGKPDPVGSAREIRDTFTRMGFTDRETVALIGGGHNFGKMHGACLTGPGPDPIEAPDAPWPGTCTNNPGPKGKGNNTFTSGFEHAWTLHPTEWTNGYFLQLKNVVFQQDVSPGGRIYWKGPVEFDPPARMLTVDIALVSDDAFTPHAHEFADDLAAHGDAFAAAWYKLHTLDMGPVQRCKGNLVPPAQPHQNPLPPAPKPSELPDFKAVRYRIKDLLYTPIKGLTSDVDSVHPVYNGALFVHLAFQCASTFRATDFAGGCNGAKIRFAPQSQWPGNAGMGEVLAALAPIQREFQALSMADLIVLAGQVALEEAGSTPIEFLGGRVDALDGANVDHLAPRTYYKSPLVQVRDDAKVRGLSPYEYVALAARPRSLVQQKRLGFSGSYTATPSRVSNELFKVLLGNTWEKHGDHEYAAQGKDGLLFVLDTDVALLWDSTYKAIVEQFAANEDVFQDTFARAWAKLMTADHFSTDEGYY